MGSEWHKKYHVLARKEATDKGLCVTCKKAPAESGKGKCRNCLLNLSQNNSKRAADLKQSGLCKDCGKVPPQKGKIRCCNCADAMTKAAGIRRASRITAGLCTECGNFPNDGLSQTCELHSAKRRGSTQKRRQLRQTLRICKFHPDRPTHGASKALCWECCLHSGFKNQIRKFMNGLGLKKDQTLTELLGCDLLTFVIRFTMLFQPGMTWQNRGNGHGRWNLDHIRPLSSFEKENASLAWHYTNLQPLWWIDNMLKSDTWNGQSVRKAKKNEQKR